MPRHPPPHTARSLAVLALFLMFPPMLTYLRPDTSMGPGTALACLIVLAAAAPSLRLDLRRRLFLLNSGEFALLALVVFAVFHFLVAAKLLPVDLWRFAGSVVVLLLMIAAARLIRPLLFGPRVTRALLLMIRIMFVVALLGVGGIQPPGWITFHKPVFPFTEPSHWTLAFLPLLMWACVTSRGWARSLYLTAALAVALALQNLTLIVGTLIVASVYAPVTRLVLLGVAAAAVVVVVAPDLTYYTERIDFSEENTNLTAQVFLQGWGMAAQAIIDTYGWGVGFQQSGINGPTVPISELIFAVQGFYSNLLDGGFVMAKLASDFGVFALVPTAAYVRLMMRSFRQLRAAARDRLPRLDSGTLYAHAVVAMFSIEIFLRGLGGYLTSTVVLFLAAVLHLHRAPRAAAELSGRSVRAAGQSRRQPVNMGN